MINLQPRILFVSYTADWTGPGNSLLLLLRYLRRRYDVSVLLPGRGPLFEALECEGITLFSLRSLTKGSLAGILRLVKREGFDLVYGNNASTGPRNALLAAKLAGIPVVCHVREMGGGKSWRDLGFLRFADATVSVSRASAASISRYVRRDRLHVVHNGVEIDSAEVDRQGCRTYLEAEAGLSPETLAIVNVAHMGPRKGQEHAVEAMARVVKSVPRAHLLLVGGLDRDASYVNKVRSKIEEKELDRNVSILGFRSDIPRLLGGADLYLHTAVSDPHPRSVIEAMGMGIPVVAFAVDGVSETVEPGQTGYLVPREDVAGMAQAIVDLADDPPLRSRLGFNGLRRAEERFSAESTAQQVGDIIDAVLSCAERRGAMRRFLRVLTKRPAGS